MKNILPCPFCGSRADTYQTEPMHSIDKEGWYIRCNTCSAELGCNVNYQGVLLGGFSSEEEAIAAWNKRFDLSEKNNDVNMLNRYDWS